MPATMQCHIVSAEEEIYSGRIAMLSLVGTLGELGVLPGHAPLLTGIRPGPVRLRDENGEEEVFYAAGGYLEIQPGVVTVLADTALRASDIDEAAAAEAQQEAERGPHGSRRRNGLRQGASATRGGHRAAKDPRGTAQAPAVIVGPSARPETDGAAVGMP